MSSKSWRFFYYRYGKYLVSVWCEKIGHFIKSRINPRTLLQNKWWDSSLLALKQFQPEGMWVCWPSMHAHNLLKPLLWEMGWIVFSWLSDEGFPMPVLCSSSATEIVTIRSRKFFKKWKKKIFLLFFQCKRKLPVIIYSNSDNWRLALSEWKLEYLTHFKHCSHGHTETMISSTWNLCNQWMIHIYAKRRFGETEA